MPVLNNSNTPRSIHFLRLNNIIGIAYCQFFFSLFIVYNQQSRTLHHPAIKRSCTQYRHTLTLTMPCPCRFVHHCRFPVMSKPEYGSITHPTAFTSLFRRMAFGECMKCSILIRARFPCGDDTIKTGKSDTVIYSNSGMDSLFQNYLKPQK